MLQGLVAVFNRVVDWGGFGGGIEQTATTKARVRALLSRVTPAQLGTVDPFKVYYTHFNVPLRLGVLEGSNGGRTETRGVLVLRRLLQRPGVVQGRSVPPCLPCGAADAKDLP